MRNASKTLLICVGVAGGIAGGCAGQDSTPAQGAVGAAAQPAGAPKDPQAAFEPRSGPGEGQKYLAAFVGEWDVVKTFYPREGSPVATHGTCSQKMIHDGRFLESDFVFDDPRGPITGMGIIGFDGETGRFTSLWTDSRSTRFSLRQSETPFDGKQIELFGKTLGDPGPNPRRSRTVSVVEDSGRKILHRQFSVAPDGAERPVMQLEMTRTK